MLTVTANPSSRASALGRLRPRRASSGVLSLLLTWQTRARDRRALRDLDDRLLADMGLSRAQVQEEASKPFWEA